MVEKGSRGGLGTISVGKKYRGCDFIDLGTLEKDTDSLKKK